MQIELKDSLEFLYPDTPAAESPCQATAQDVARGGTASVHVVVRDVKAGDALRLALREKGRAVRGAKWFRLLDVPVEVNTGLDGFLEREGQHNDFVARRAPFRVYDAMEPVGMSVRASAATQVFRLHLPVPVDSRPGARECVIEVRSGAEARELSLRVVVHKSVIPPIGSESLPYTNWFSFANMAERHGLKPWTEAHWRMIREYAKLMAWGRQNTFWVPLGDVFTAKNDVPVLDRERLRRIVRVFTGAGMHFIEGGHVGSRSGGKWDATTFDTNVVVRRATSPEGNAVLAHFGRQLMEEIDRNGWRERWIQHATDEPVKENAVDYRILVGMTRRHFPGLPILDATMDTGLAGSVDIWCPKANEYQIHRSEFEAQRALGDRVWFYTCCTPGGPWLNRLLDMELLRPAYFGWASARFRLDGFLHWGLNHYPKGQDPFQANVVRFDKDSFLPAGDTHIVYPGKDSPWSSLRLEAQREGFEDYELLKRLQPRNAKKADAIIAKVLRGMDDYTKDVAEFRAARRALLEALD